MDTIPLKCTLDGRQGRGEPAIAEVKRKTGDL